MRTLVATVPAPPEAVGVTNTSETGVALAWQAPDDHGDMITGYLVEMQNVSTHELFFTWGPVTTTVAPSTTVPPSTLAPTLVPATTAAPITTTTTTTTSAPTQAPATTSHPSAWKARGCRFAWFVAMFVFVPLFWGA